MKLNVLFSIYVNNIKNEVIKYKDLTYEREDKSFKKLSKAKLNKINNIGKMILKMVKHLMI